MALKPQKAIIEFSLDQRGRSRRKLRLEVNAQASGLASSTAIVHDISETGLLIEISAILEVGDVIDVELSKTNIKLAEVVWASGDLAGCKFVEHLTAGTISAALLQGSFTKPASNAQIVHKASALSREIDSTVARKRWRMPFLTKMLVIFGLTSLLWTAAVALVVWLIP